MAAVFHPLHRHPWFRDEFLALADEIGSRSGIERHYYHVAQRHFAQHVQDPEGASVKKLFYVLRPLLAARWLQQRPQQRIAPTAFPALVAETDLPPHLIEIIDELIRLKAGLAEHAHRPVPQMLMAFISAEFDRMSLASTAPGPTEPQHKEVAIRFLLKSVERLAPEG